MCGGEQDGQSFMTGIQYIKVVGTPLYNFLGRSATTIEDALSELHISRPPGLSLCSTQHTLDPLLLAGRKPASSPQAVVLEYISPDPLIEEGGLYRVSEMGRLPYSHMRKAWRYDFGRDYRYSDYDRYPAEDMSE